MEAAVVSYSSKRANQNIHTAPASYLEAYQSPFRIYDILSTLKSNTNLCFYSPCVNMQVPRQRVGTILARGNFIPDLCLRLEMIFLCFCNNTNTNIDCSTGGKSCTKALFLSTRYVQRVATTFLDCHAPLNLSRSTSATLFNMASTLG